MAFDCEETIEVSVSAYLRKTMDDWHFQKQAIPRGKLSRVCGSDPVHGTIRFILCVTIFVCSRLAQS